MPVRLGSENGDEEAAVGFLCHRLPRSENMSVTLNDEHTACRGTECVSNVFHVHIVLIGEVLSFLSVFFSVCCLQLRAQTYQFLHVIEKKSRKKKQSKTKCHTGHPLRNGHSTNVYQQACIPLLRSVLTRDSEGEIYRPRIKYEGNLQRSSDLSQMLFHNPAALGTFPQHAISKSCSAWISCLSS